MYLLSTATLKLHAFHAPVPQYAILSHTWEDEEVSFEEMGDPAAEEKRGYHKIKQCCKRAKDDGYEYVWIDTCCIDKRSSAELSEAINSMFRWYRQAHVCYAHLADVSDGHNPQQSRSEFLRSKWFKRGWTLQELIAPAKIIFLAGPGWVEIGTKATLRYAISRVTGISLRILDNADELFMASVAQRMSWASGRQTTRSEDIAYCLLGILNVTMPLLYGEGEYAFIRLQLELLRLSNEHTIFAWRQSNFETRETGLLATSPAAFKGCGDVVQSTERNTPSHSVTNIGLSITLPTVRSSQGPLNVYIAYLDCTSARYGRVCLYLYRRRESHFSRLGLFVSEYGRIWAQRTPMFIDLTLSTFETGGAQPLYYGQLSDRGSPRLVSGISLRRHLLATPWGAHDVEGEQSQDRAANEANALLPRAHERVDTMLTQYLNAFLLYTFLVLARNYIHVLLGFVPLGIIAGVFDWSPIMVFTLNLIALIPLASILGFASEELPRKLGPRFGGLMEETLANAIEFVLSILALIRGDIRLVHMILLGSMLSKMLFVLGNCILVGTIRYGERKVSSKAAPAMCSIAAATVSFLLIPQIVIASAPYELPEEILVLSHGMAILFLGIFVLYMFFRLVSAADFLDERVYLGDEPESRLFGPFPAALVLMIGLLMVTVCGSYLVSSIADVAETTQLDKTFLSAIVLPLVISSAELAPAVFSTYEDTMNLAISVVVGSGMQIALFVMPFLVILGWVMHIIMPITLGAFESLHLFLAVMVLNYQVQDGNSTYLASVICLVTYTITAFAFYLRPVGPSDIN